MKQKMSKMYKMSGITSNAQKFALYRFQKGKRERRVSNVYLKKIMAENFPNLKNETESRYRKHRAHVQTR